MKPPKTPPRSSTGKRQSPPQPGKSPSRAGKPPRGGPEGRPKAGLFPGRPSQMHGPSGKKPARRPEGRAAGAGGRALAPLDPEQHVFGRHAVTAVLTHQVARAQRLYLQKSAQVEALEELARAAGIEVVAVDGDALEVLAGKSAAHQGAVLRCGPFPYVDIEDFAEAPPLTLVLDGVEDPRNLGAAARAAFALGASLVVVPRERAAACTASAHKAAAGALSRVDVAQVGNLRRALEMLREKGAWIVGAEANAAKAPWQVDLTGQIALVVGGEDRGLRRLTREVCDHVVSIPMTGGGDVSLNAADAATVLLYEALRQRKQPVSQG